MNHFLGFYPTIWRVLCEGLGMKPTDEFLHNVMNGFREFVKDVGEDVRFVQPQRAVLAGDVVVKVNLGSLDDDWKRDKTFYVAPGGGGGIGSRYSRFGDWLKLGKPVEMPEASLVEGRLVFLNGRHRVAWFRDRGFSCVPFSVPADLRDEFVIRYAC